MLTNKERNISLDWIRFVACVLVILQHVCEFYYVAPDFTPARTENAFLVGVFNSLSRTSVPVFVMLSGFLLLPMKQTTTEFFKRRFTRVLFPFVIWSVIYSIYFVLQKGESFTQWILNVLHLPFAYEAEHFWYIYMLIGLYILIPVISPWLQQVSRRGLRFYLGIWIFTTFLPYLRLMFPSIGADVFFNPSPTFHYFSGFAGYLLLGHYLRKYGSLNAIASILAIAIGWAATSWGFIYQLKNCITIEELELCWGFCTFNVVLMCVGLFSLLLKIRQKDNGCFTRWVVSVSTLSYGIYLCHVLWLRTYMSVFMPIFDSVILVALVAVPCTFISSYLTIFFLKFLPKSKLLY